jgi:hypothetical protein
MRLLDWIGTSSTSKIRVVEEGVDEWFNKWTAKSFYRVLGGYDIHTNFDFLQTPKNLRPISLRHPVLFICDYSKIGYVIKMIGTKFSQGHLLSTLSAIIDAHFAIFVWYGRDSCATIRHLTNKVACKYCKYFYILYNL